MSLLDILGQYGSGAGASGDAIDHYDQVAREAPPAQLADGLAAAFRSEQTPPFPQMLARMFGQADPRQRAGILNQLLASLGPAAIAALANGPLRQIFQRGAPAPAPGPVVITPDQAAQVTPEQAQEVAQHAQAHQPSIVDSMGDFFSRHRDLVKTLGGAALAIALARMANNRRG